MKNQMELEHVKRCPVCNGNGTILYRDVPGPVCNTSRHWTMRRCTSIRCRTVWLDPRPARSSIRDIYSNYYTHGGTSPPTVMPILGRWDGFLSKGYLSWKYGYFPGQVPAIQKVLSLLSAVRLNWRLRIDNRHAMYLQHVSGGRVLDVGCGNGEVLCRLRDLGWTVAGVEPDPKAAAQACAKGIEVMVGSVDEFICRGEMFDAIITRHVIEHLHSPQAALSACFSLLKQGGYMVINCPNAASLGHYCFGACWFPLLPPQHLMLFTSLSLKKLVENAGFKIIRVFSVPNEGHHCFKNSLESRLGLRPSGIKKMPGLFFNALGRAFQLFESVGTGLGISWGEELVVIARKSE